jgi:bifunctional enzyme CysN/CysC
VHASQKDGPFRMPVQWVNRPDHDFRGFSGMVVGGTVRPGDRVRVLPSGRESTVARLVTFDGDLTEAGTGRSITVTLADEVDVSRGDVLAAAASAPAVADQFEATVVWMSEQEMLPGRSYLLKIGARTVGATPAQAKYKIDVNTLEHLPAKTLELNEIGVCNINLDAPVPFDPYEENRDMGGFILIDRLTNATVAAGLLHFALRRADNLPTCTGRPLRSTGPPTPHSKGSDPASSGSPESQGPANPPSPTLSSASSTSRAGTPTSSTGTTCGTA